MFTVNGKITDLVISPSIVIEYILFCDSRFYYFTHYKSDVKMEGAGIPSASIMYSMIFYC